MELHTIGIDLGKAAGLQMWESRMRFPSLALAKRHLPARQRFPCGKQIGSYLGLIPLRGILQAFS